MGQPLYTAKQFIAAIPGTGGIITQIAKKVGCSWNTARKYIDNHPTVLQAYQDECETIMDMAEAALYKSVREQESWAVKYLLSTKGKERGYIERREQEIDASPAMQQHIKNFNKLAESIYGNSGPAEPDQGR